MDLMPRKLVGYGAATDVPAQRSRQEVEELLHRHHCTQYMTAVDWGMKRARVQFKLHDRIVRFEVALPDNSKSGWEQRERQRWRQLLLVIKAKLEAVAFNISTFEEEFLAHIVLPGDVTVGMLALPLVAEAYGTGKLPAGLSLPAKGESGV
jgi:hypothetical protein